MTEAEEAAQISAFSIGQVGYLRQDYPGEPVAIAAALMRKRLPATLSVADTRERTVYAQTDPRNVYNILRSYGRFV